jgi:hypothetical protein
MALRARSHTAANACAGRAPARHPCALPHTRRAIRCAGARPGGRPFEGEPRQQASAASTTTGRPRGAFVGLKRMFGCPSRARAGAHPAGGVAARPARPAPRAERTRHARRRAAATLPAHRAPPPAAPLPPHTQSPARPAPARAARPRPRPRRRRPRRSSPRRRGSPSRSRGRPRRAASTRSTTAKSWASAPTSRPTTRATATRPTSGGAPRSRSSRGATTCEGRARGRDQQQLGAHGLRGSGQLWRPLQRGAPPLLCLDRNRLPFCASHQPPAATPSRASTTRPRRWRCGAPRCASSRRCSPPPRAASSCRPTPSSTSGQCAGGVKGRPRAPPAPSTPVPGLGPAPPRRPSIPVPVRSWPPPFACSRAPLPPHRRPPGRTRSPSCRTSVTC